MVTTTVIILLKISVVTKLDFFQKLRRTYHHEVNDHNDNTFEGVISLQKEWIVPYTPDKNNIVIVSSWRSGSSFLGGIFESSSEVMYFYEPFHDYGPSILRLSLRECENILKSKWSFRMVVLNRSPIYVQSR